MGRRVLLATGSTVLFIWYFTGRGLKHTRRTAVLLALPGLVYLLLLPVLGRQPAMRSEIRLEPGSPFDIFTYQMGPVTYLVAGYMYLLALAGFALLLQTIRRTTHRLYRNQAALILVAVLVPVVGTSLVLLGISFGQHRDTSPWSFAISNLILAWALFRYQLLDVMPVARDEVFASLQDVVLVIDPQSRLVDANPAARRILEMDGDIAGRPVAEVLAPWRDLFERFDDQEQAVTELRVPYREGWRDLDLRISPLLSRSGQVNGRLVIVRDITEQKEAQRALNDYARQLETANEELRELSQVKDDFVANVSHELRTPLSNLKLHLGLLEIRPERWPDYLPTVKREAGRLESLIEGILLLSRLDKSAGIQRERVELNALVTTFVADRQPLAEKRDLYFEAHPLAEDCWVRVDQGLIGQVLGNLMTNAFQYTPPGGRVDVFTQVAAGHNGGWAGFRVADTGPGVDPADRPHLFERFYRGQAGLPSKLPGTGLGLAIAQEIVGRHHGRIEIESEGIPGRGTTVHVWLPAER